MSKREGGTEGVCICISIYFANLSFQSLSSLEMALSRDFEVKNFPLYHLISGCVHRETGNMQQALESLETVLKICRAKKTVQKPIEEGGGGGGRGGGGAVRGRGELGVSEVATVYLELVGVLSKLGKQVRRGRGG